MLVDREKPLWPEVRSPATTRISDEEMARINIEASAALAEWIDLQRNDEALYRQLMNRAVAYLPMPTRTSKAKDNAFASPVTFEHCWSFGQPGPTATSASDGNGFKLCSPATLAAGGNAPHKLVSCFAFNNRGSGFTANGNSSGKITCTNCGAWGNGTAWSPGTGGVAPQHTGDITNLSVTVDKAMNAPRDANGNLPDIARL